MKTKADSHSGKSNGVIKFKLSAGLRRRAEYAKVDLDLDWTDLIGQAMEMFLDALDAAERPGFEEIAAALMRGDDEK